MSNARLLLLGVAAAGLTAVLWNDVFGTSARPISSTANMRDTVEIDVRERTISTKGSIRQFEASPNNDNSPTTSPNAPVTLNTMLQLDPDQFVRIVENPLFSTTRRPPAPKPKPKPKPVIVRKPPPPREPPLRVKLVGIVKGNGRRIALLRDPGSSKTMRLLTGDKVQVWQIENIGDATVRFRHKKWTRELTLFKR